MSWADDIRCLYCDGRLPLYRKITNGQFCSTAHRKAYWAEQERLAVERLHQTHDSLRAYRPVGNPDAILGHPEPEPAPPAGPALVAMPQPQPQPEERPWWLPQVNSGELPVAGFVPDSAPLRVWWMKDSVAGGDPAPAEYVNAIRRPVAVFPEFDCGFSVAPHVFPEIHAAEPAREESSAAPLLVAIAPVCELALQAAPETLELNTVELAAVEPDPAPLCESLFALAGPSMADPGPFAPCELEPLTPVMRAQLPLGSIRLQVRPPSSGLLAAGLHEISLEQSSAIPAPAIDNLRAVDIQASAPQFTLSTPPLRPRLQLAAGRRYQVAGREPAPEIATFSTSNLPSKPAPVALPDREVKVIRSATVDSVPQEPEAAGLLPLACADPVISGEALAIRPAPTALSLPQPPKTAPMRPSSKLEPLDAKPVADVFAPPPQPLVEENVAAPIPAFVPPPPPQKVEPHKVHIWVHAIDFWNRAPRDLKMLSVAIPLLLGLALHPSLPKVRVAAPAAASGFQKSFTNVVNDQWSSMQRGMVDRAAVALDEDFRSGLDEWVSRGDATTDWSFDATGFVRPGPLAMYRPSMALTDYQMQFLGMIDRKSLSWVVRAVDFDNYYVIKLVVLKGGPLPTIGVTRYAVINGKADSRADTVVPVDAREDMLYRVRVDVHGDDFALSVQGQMVDSWSEPRLSHGGVGFFAAPGEESRLRWVQVTHQYDMLGRLCAYLAPYNITSSSGSWQQ